MAIPILKKPWVQKILSRLLAGYISLVWHTSSWTIEGKDLVFNKLSKRRPLIVVFWHNRMVMAPFAWFDHVPFSMLISRHADGVLIAKTIAHFGLDTVEGSSSKGGGMALRKMIDLLRQGRSVGLTPDGPRGPREQLKDGVFALSCLSQCEVVALSYATSRSITLTSWDKMYIPLPFSKGALVMAESECPVAQRDDQDFFMKSLHKALTKVTKRAQLLVKKS